MYSLGTERKGREGGRERERGWEGKGGREGGREKEGEGGRGRE